MEVKNMGTRKLIAEVVLAVILAGGIGSMAGTVYQQGHQPSCPTEDSCQINYHDGRWYIKEVVP